MAVKTVAYVVEFPLDNGDTHVLVEVDRVSSDDLVPAAPDVGRVIGRASKTLEATLGEIEPAIKAVVDWMGRASPHEFAIEFGLKLRAHTGVIIASGTADVNFVVKLTWRP